MDFGALPPEVNSALIYTGPGSAPMMAVSAAFGRLAAALTSAAIHYDSVVSNLTGEHWRGSASEAMAAAIRPYVGWMRVTAGQVQHAAAQAAASAAAFETAFAVTVPPAAVAANRAQLAALVATNVLGLNTPAIMAVEAHYGQMWAQDAAAMYGYAAASSAAAALTPPTAPALVANPAGPGLQAAAVGRAAASSATQGLSRALVDLPPAVAGLAGPFTALGAADVISSIDGLLGTPFVSIGVDGAVSAAAWWSMNTIPNSVLAGHALGLDAPPPAVAHHPGGTATAPGPALVRALPSAAAAPAVAAGVGRGSPVGGLSVPATWFTAAPAPTAPAAAAMASGWAAAESSGTPLVPAGIPPGAAGRGAGAPRYGVKPTVMPRTGLL